MKKIYLISFLLIQYSCLFSGFGNKINIYPPELIDFINDPAEFPNKPTIERPLPKEAYEDMYEKHKNIFTPSKDFIKFLKNRSHFNDDYDEINRQWLLIQALTLNYKNKNLTSFTNPMVMFAVDTTDLYRHQISAEIGIHPIQVSLTKFEQNYTYKLKQIDILEYLYIMENLNITHKNYYKSVILKKWARFLLKKLTKK